MATIVPPELRSTVFGIDRFLENLFGYVAAALVGVLSESVFGFATGDSGVCSGGSGGASSGGESVADLASASALGAALLTLTAPPAFVCVMFYTCMHWTYGNDRRLAQERVGPTGLL